MCRIAIGRTRPRPAPEATANAISWKGSPAPATPTTLTFRLTVQGPGGPKTTDEVVTVAAIAPPRANAGPPQTVLAGSTVTLDGSATSISGKVVAVGMLSTVSSSGTASDPVTIGLAAGAPTLFAGSDAQVAIILAQVSDAVTVPTSAVEGGQAAANAAIDATDPGSILDDVPTPAG